MKEKQLEPLVHEEQGVVFLFSRYWDKIKKMGTLENQRIFSTINSIKSINVQFPDGSYHTKNGKLGGIEFKEKKSKFLKDYCKKGKFPKLTNFRESYDHSDYDKKTPLLFVYWLDDNPSKYQVQKLIKNFNIRFINLSEEFEPAVKKSKFGLSTFLKFKGNKKFKSEKATYKNIENSAERLESKGIIKLNKPNEDYVKVLGHDSKGGADDIDIRQWRLIHMYTTTGKNKFAKNKPPSRIFFVPRGENGIIGYIKPKLMFSINDRNKTKKWLAKFYKNHYFFKPYKDEEGYCIIYNKFELLEKGKGIKLFEEIKKVTKKRWQSKGLSIESKEYPELFKKLMKEL